MPDTELNNPGHVLVAPRLDNKDGSLTTSVVVDCSRLLVPTVPGGEHLALHLGQEHVLEAGDVDIRIVFACLLMMVMMHLGLEHVLEAGDVDRGRDYKASRSLAERLGRVRETKTWKQHSNQH